MSTDYRLDLTEQLAVFIEATGELQASLHQLETVIENDPEVVTPAVVADLAMLTAMLDRAESQLREAAARLTDGPADATVTP